ncbi:MAG: DUF1570 domain-containing protein, partial [Planctomycetota bacterium]|nr:DUF1570 domain-containing protein [Planctomycetota bacterium]
GELIGLEELVSLTAPPAGAAPTRRAYAQAWGLFHYLFQCRREQLRKYLSVSAQAPAGEPGSQEFRQRFVACFGEIAPLQDEFLRFIDGGDSPATDSSADTSSGDLPPG